MSPEARAAMTSHMASCPSCQRYDRVVRKGVAVLRSAPEPKPRHRLGVVTVRRRARLAERRENRRLEAEARGSSTIVGAVAFAAVLACVAALPIALRRRTGDGAAGSGERHDGRSPATTVPASGSRLSSPAPLQPSPASLGAPPSRPQSRTPRLAVRSRSQRRRSSQDRRSCTAPTRTAPTWTPGSLTQASAASKTLRRRSPGRCSWSTVGTGPAWPATPPRPTSRGSPLVAEGPGRRQGRGASSTCTARTSTGSWKRPGRWSSATWTQGRATSTSTA